MNSDRPEKEEEEEEGWERPPGCHSGFLPGCFAAHIPLNAKAEPPEPRAKSGRMH